MSTNEPSTFKPLPAASALNAREVLRAAWPLFHHSLPGCLPLALVGVAASATPVAESVARGEAHGFSHGADWWGLYAASTVLALVCLGGILRQQLAIARREQPQILASLRQGLIGLLPALGVVGLGLLALPAIAPIVWFYFGWTAQVDERLGPLAALRRSVQLVRGRFLAVAGIVLAMLAAILVFVLLTGILMAVVMNLAGIGAQSGHGGLSVSRWLMAALLSLPVVYAGAVSVTSWQAATQARSGQP